MVVCLFGGGGEGFVTDPKIALSSPVPFVPEEKERVLSIEKARPDQGLAGESPARCPFPPFPEDDYAPYLWCWFSHSRRRKGRKRGEGRELSPKYSVPVFSGFRTKRERAHPRKKLALRGHFGTTLQ